MFSRSGRIFGDSAASEQRRGGRAKGDAEAEEREDIAVAHVESDRRVLRHVDDGEKNTFAENGAVGVGENLADTSEVIDGGGDAVVRAADHRAAVFGATKDGVGEVLLSGGALLEPSGVGEGDEHLRALVGGVAGEVAEGVLEANERGDFHRGLFELEHDGTVTCGEVGRHHVADDDGEEREAVAEWNVFAEHDKVRFAVNLWFARRAIDQDSGVVVRLMREDECAEKQRRQIGAPNGHGQNGGFRVAGVEQAGFASAEASLPGAGADAGVGHASGNGVS